MRLLIAANLACRGDIEDKALKCKARSVLLYIYPFTVEKTNRAFLFLFFLGTFVLDSGF